MRTQLNVLLTGAVASLLSANTLAAVTAVTTSPASTQIGLGRSTSVSVTWSATTNTAGGVTVSSAQGVFVTPGGALLATIAQPLSKAISGPTTATFPEGVLVPADVVQRAHKEGHDHLFYRRAFTDGGAANGQIKLYISTQKAASFGVSRVAIGFDGGDPLRVVSRGEVLKAKAQISFTGAGLLKATWEIAGPNPDAEHPQWRALAEVAQGLTGAETATLTSPALPTDSTAPYLVRLRISEPAIGFDVPAVRYSVIDKNR